MRRGNLYAAIVVLVLLYAVTLYAGWSLFWAAQNWQSLGAATLDMASKVAIVFVVCLVGIGLIHASLARPRRES